MAPTDGDTRIEDPLLKPCPSCQNPEPHTMWFERRQWFCNRCGGLDASAESAKWDR
jgi:hypothetical protein